MGSTVQVRPDLLSVNRHGTDACYFNILCLVNYHSAVSVDLSVNRSESRLPPIVTLSSHNNTRHDTLILGNHDLVFDLIDYSRL